MFGRTIRKIILKKMIFKLIMTLSSSSKDEKKPTTGEVRLRPFQAFVIISMMIFWYERAWYVLESETRTRMIQYSE